MGKLYPRFMLFMNVNLPIGTNYRQRGISFIDSSFVMYADRIMSQASSPIMAKPFVESHYIITRNPSLNKVHGKGFCMIILALKFEIS